MRVQAVLVLSGGVQKKKSVLLANAYRFIRREG